MSFKFIRWCACYDIPTVEAAETGTEQGHINKKHRIRIYKLKTGSKKFKILLLNHNDDEVKREMVIASMGGEACPCVQVARKSKEFAKGAVIEGRQYDHHKHLKQ